MAEIHRLSLREVTIKVKLPYALPLKIWIAKRLIIAATWVLGCGHEIKTAGEK